VVANGIASGLALIALEVPEEILKFGIRKKSVECKKHTLGVLL
jgi:hypothetical protein